jgi:hypothetical protein
VDVAGTTIWQVAAGDTDRNYVDLCLKWDVILNGPGSEGAWPECRQALRNDGHLSSRKTTDLHRFAEEIQDGDYVVLRMGTAKVFGFGVVVGDYEWHEEFGDIDGWDVEHVRRLRWLWHDNGKPVSFPKYTLKLGDTVQRLDSPRIIDWIAGLSIDQQTIDRQLIRLPAPSNGIEWDSASHYLFDQGVASNVIATVTKAIAELIRISRWYQRTGGPSEFETVVYLVIPLLRALGWTPQKMAVEWKNVDVALFNVLPRDDGNLSVVVEAKQMDRSCLSAKSQAGAYAEQEGRSSCGRLIVTDGVRYGVYLKEDGVFSNQPAAYLNLTRMREAYPLLNCKGTKEAFLFMSADWVPTKEKA